MLHYHMPIKYYKNKISDLKYFLLHYILNNTEKNIKHHSWVASVGNSITLDQVYNRGSANYCG